MERSELDLLEVFRILRRRLWLIIALPLIAALAAGVLSLYVLQPVYSASTTLWVIKDGSGKLEYADLLTNRNLTKTYAEVAKSRAVMADVIERLGLGDATIPQLQRKLTVTPVRDTEILSFTVEDGNPEQATRLADAIAAAFMAQIRTYMKVENVKVVDSALIPTSPIRPRPFLNAVIAALLGGIIAVGITFLLEYLDTSMKTPEDVTRVLGLPVLGIIPVIETKEGEASQRRSKARTSHVRAVIEK